MRLSLPAALFLCALPAAAERRSWLDTITDRARDQCETGSCHAWASAVLLESALNRQAMLSEKTALSVGDLFVQARIQRPTVTASFKEEGCGREIVLPMLFEGQAVIEDLKLALREGVALEEDYPWKVFLRRFRGFRARFAEACSSAARVFRGTPGAEEVAEILKPLRAMVTSEETSAILYGDEAKRVQDGRLAVKKKFKGTRPVTRPFLDPAKVGEAKKTDWPCSGEERRVRRRALLDRLQSKGVVAVRMRFDGLAAWRGTGKGKTDHAVAVVGYSWPHEQDLEAPAVFQTLNSWGGDNPDIPEDQLCRLIDLAYLESGGPPDPTAK